MFPPAVAGTVLAQHPGAFSVHVELLQEAGSTHGPGPSFGNSGSPQGAPSSILGACQPAPDIGRPCGFLVPPVAGKWESVPLVLSSQQAHVYCTSAVFCIVCRARLIGNKAVFWQPVHLFSELIPQLVQNLAEPVIRPALNSHNSLTVVAFLQMRRVGPKSLWKFHVSPGQSNSQTHKISQRKLLEDFAYINHWALQRSFIIQKPGILTPINTDIFMQPRVLNACACSLPSSGCLGISSLRSFNIPSCSLFGLGLLSHPPP